MTMTDEKIDKKMGEGERVSERERESKRVCVCYRKCVFVMN